MLRFLAGVASAVLLMAAGIFVFNTRAAPDNPLPPQPRQALAAGAADEPLPDRVPEATARTREQKRFDRYDKDRNGTVTREEYLASRRKAYAKLDADGDGRLSFDEWAVKTTGRFTGADADRTGTLTAAEFATTAPKRRPRPARANCPPPAREEES